MRTCWWNHKWDNQDLVGEYTTAFCTCTVCGVTAEVCSYGYAPMSRDEYDEAMLRDRALRELINERVSILKANGESD